MSEYQTRDERFRVMLEEQGFDFVTATGSLKDYRPFEEIMEDAMRFLGITIVDRIERK